MPTQSQLQVISLRFEKVLIEPVDLPESEDFDSVEKFHPLIEVTPTITGFDESPRDWILEVDFKIGPPPEGFYPYKAEISAVGYFRIDEKLLGKDEESLVHLIGVNGTSMIYGSTREMYAQVVSRGRYDSVPPLPSMDFRDAAVSQMTSKSS